MINDCHLINLIHFWQKRKKYFYHIPNRNLMYNWIELYQKIIVDKFIIDFKNCTFFLFTISLLKILNINEFSQICIRGKWFENCEFTKYYVAVLTYHSEKDNKCLPQPPEQSGTRVLWLEVIETRSLVGMFIARQSNSFKTWFALRKNSARIFFLFPFFLVIKICNRVAFSNWIATPNVDFISTHKKKKKINSSQLAIIFFYHTE